jgi:hypothetical protein
VRPRLQLVSAAKSLNPTGFWAVLWFFVNAVLTLFLGYWILAFLFFVLGARLAVRMLRRAQRCIAESEAVSPLVDVFPWEEDD